MKGMVFTELLDMAETTLGEEVVDDILDGLELENDGAYSAVGNYPCSELVKIVGAISDQTGLPGDELQRLFGRHMLHRFSKTYPQFFADKATVLDMLDAIENEVHVEVRKLYPDAELPTFGTEWLDGRTLRMTYRSQRPLVAFCRGLIEACAEYFGTDVEITQERHDTGATNVATFLVRMTG